MSRNSRRTSVPKPQAPLRPSVPSAPQAPPNPFGVSFVIPTEVVSLPSRGKYYDPQSTMFNRESVEIKQMTAKQEEILSNLGYLEDGSMIERLISSILIDTSVNAAELMPADQNAIIIAARRSSYGNLYEVEQACGDCKGTHIFTFDLDKTTIKEGIPEDVVMLEDSGYFQFELPQTGLKTVIKVLTSSDEIYLKEQNEKALKLKIENSETVNFLRRVIISVNGITDTALLNELYEVLPVLDIRKIKKILRDITPSLDTSQEVACSGCGITTESEVPFSLGFFWPDL